jgi:putative pyruvate formate lyase activating enzyme
MSTPFEPGYIRLLAGGELARRVQAAYEHLRSCDLCAWECRVDRRAGKLGFCRTAERARVSSFGPHLGEEDPLRGWRGSGTIFFNRCNLRCQYCQNYEISQVSGGQDIEPELLANMMLELQALGCHNINFVSPSHVIAPILAAVLIAAQAGLRLPLVYNTGGYDSLAALALLDGVIDIYMPDTKYSNAVIARKYSKIPHYPRANQAAVKEMYRQVGDLQLDQDGLAQRGLLVRHLILPFGQAGTEEIVRFIAEELSPSTYLNLMDQYHPAYNATDFPRLKRRITPEEYAQAIGMARSAGLIRLDRRKPLSWIED